MRIVLAVLMALHGIAHLPGFINAWRLAELEGMPYRTTVLGGRVDLGDPGTRAVGVMWLLAALAFCAVGVAAGLRQPGWVQAALWTGLFSLGLTVLYLPEARVGAAVNVALAAVLAYAAWTGWS
jgi:hypothetical protein